MYLLCETTNTFDLTGILLGPLYDQKDYLLMLKLKELLMEMIISILWFTQPMSGGYFYWIKIVFLSHLANCYTKCVAMYVRVSIM